MTIYISRWKLLQRARYDKVSFRRSCSSVGGCDGGKTEKYDTNFGFSQISLSASLASSQLSRLATEDEALRQISCCHLHQFLLLAFIAPSHLTVNRCASWGFRIQPSAPRLQPEHYFIIWNSLRELISPEESVTGFFVMEILKPKNQ